MSNDINCAVCGEPFNQWGLNHGDMKAWETDLFKKGAGCPCCLGIVPAGSSLGATILEHVQSVFSRAEDPHSFELANTADFREDNDPLPKWEEPKEPLKKYWSCARCEVSAAVSLAAPYDGKNLSKDPIWLEWFGGEKLHYKNGGGPYTYGDVARGDGPPLEAPFTVNGLPHCPGCAKACGECGGHIFASNEDLDDVYDPGYGHLHPSDMGESVCTMCFEKLDAEQEEFAELEEEEESDEDSEAEAEDNAEER